jgi:hypothetical protein
MTLVGLLDIGLGELLVCAIVALLLFGGRLPEAMGRVGGLYRKFRGGLDDLKRTIDAPAAAPPRYRPTPPAPSPSPAPLSQGLGPPPAPSTPSPRPSTPLPQRSAPRPPAIDDDAPPV